MLLTNVRCTGTESVIGDCDIDDLKAWKECASENAVRVKCERGNLVLDAREPMKFMNQRISTVMEDDEIEPMDVKRDRNAPYGIQNEQPVSSKVILEEVGKLLLSLGHRNKSACNKLHSKRPLNFENIHNLYTKNIQKSSTYQVTSIFVKYFGQ